MADMYGTICSNTFSVNDIEAFKNWFKQYHFGQDVRLFIDGDNKHVSFGGHGQYPSAFPRIWNDEEENYDDTDVVQFSQELCEHLSKNEFVNIVAGGNEKLRYCAFDQVIIHKDYPDQPVTQCISSEMCEAQIIDRIELQLSKSMKL